MNDREKFEKFYPISSGVVFNEQKNCYVWKQYNDTRHIETDENWQTWLAAKEEYSPKSPLEQDAVPTFYIEPESENAPDVLCTHRLSDRSIPVWTSAEGYKYISDLWLNAETKENE